MKSVGMLVVALLLHLLAAVIYAGSNYDASNRPILFEMTRAKTQVIHPSMMQGGASRQGEFLLNMNVVYSPTPADQKRPAIACCGTNYLIVWEDGRDTPTHTNIYGALVDQSGVILDPNGFCISGQTGVNCINPAAAFDGTNFLVVWESVFPGGRYANIQGVRVSQTGEVLDSNWISISSSSNNQSDPSVAFDGTNYLVVWQDSRNNPISPDIYGARVTQSGQVLDPNGIAICTANDQQLHPAVSFGGADYLVVWQDKRGTADDIYGARVSQAGVVIDPNSIQISSLSVDETDASIAFDGTNFLVAWTYTYTGGNVDIYAARVSQAGLVLDPAGILVTVAASGFWPTVCFDNSTGYVYMVAWVQGNPPGSIICAARISVAGVVLDPAGINISAAGFWLRYYPAIAFNGANYLIAWQDNRNTDDWDIYGARVSPAGVVLGGIGVSISTNSQSNCILAWGSPYWLAAWGDGIPGSSSVYGTRMLSSGVIMDPWGLLLDYTGQGLDLSPSASYNGANYLVAWHEASGDSRDNDIKATRVDQAGQVLDTTGIAICTNANEKGYTAATSDGSNYFVVWQEYRAGSSYDIYGARVSAAGVVLDPSGIAISSATDMQMLPAVAFDGTNYLVVWEDYRAGYAHIYGSLVSTAGQVLNPSGIAISSGPYNQWSAALSFDGTNYLVAWEDNRSGTHMEIYGCRVSQTGQILDPAGIAISSGSFDQLQPALAYDGSYYLVAWDDYRSGSPDIYGAIVETSGNVIDTFAIVALAGDQIDPALSHANGDTILITYSGWTDSIDSQPVNTMRIWGKFYQFIGIEEGEKVHESRIYLGPSIFRGPLQLPEGKECRVFDITGRIVEPKAITRGIYFIEIDNRIVRKVVKVR